ncbi:WD40/YVTN/BNR-like repeat-containing protein [Sphingomonas sp. DT-204]|uniref:WD40/YVTN/BNR-like repeat-containing protein n=1 Tax=Sphingomonas sp. DT-204 TaxID=3396166 RepID=UPI003F1B28F6
MKGRFAFAMGAGILLAVTAVQASPELVESVPYNWRNAAVGGGGFAPGIVFSPIEPGLAYLRTDMGGAYRWDAKAGRWIPLQDDQAISSYMGIESIAPDPVDPDVVYLAAGMSKRGEAAIFRSGDRGAHWRIVSVPFAMGGNEDGRGLGERLAVDPHRHETLFFGSRHDGLWRSDDAGAHWKQVASFPRPGRGRPAERRATNGGLSFVLFDPMHRGRLFVASADSGGTHLFRSDDGGVRWAPVAGGPTDDLLPVKGVVGRDGILTITWSDGIGPTGITRGGVWRYDPAVDRWADVTPERGAGAPPGGYMGVAVSARDPKVIAVSTVNRYKPIDTVWRSTDAGKHWDELWRRSERDVRAAPFLDLDGKADFGHWIAGLAIDPFDDSHAAYVTGATLYATHDFGRRGTMLWRPWTRGIEQTAIITLVSPTGGAPLVSGFGDIAGFRHDDLTVSPPHVHRNPYLTNTNTLDYAGLAPAIMVRSGSTHSPIVPGPSLAWSADGGTSWTPLATPPSQPRAYGSPSPEQTGDTAITVSADGTTFVVETDRPLLTADRGRTWQAIEGLPGRTRVTADKADARRFYASDFAANRMLRSDDGGRHFQAVRGEGLPADLSGARVTWREAQNPLAATPGRAGALWLKVGGDLYRSVDAGERWTRTGIGLDCAYYGLGHAAPGSDLPAIYAIGRRNGLYAIWRSLDGGDRWQRINDDRHQWGLRFRVISGDPRRFGRVYIGTDGRGIVYGDPIGRKGQ